MSTAELPMQTAVKVPPGLSPPWPVKRFSVAEYQQLTEDGKFCEDDNLELLEGWLVPRMAKNLLHDIRVDMLNNWLVRHLPEGWYVRVQNSFVTRDSVPEPDLAVLRGEAVDYEQRHPTATDAALLIEVADSSVDYDRQKLPIYARAGVPQVWIFTLESWQLECYSQPRPDGTFAARKTLKVTDTASFELPDHAQVQVPLSAVLKPPVTRK